MLELEQNLKLLGLNDNQCKAYIFILKNKKVNPGVLAKKLGISPSRASRMLKEMVQKKFLKTFFAGRERYYFINDIKKLKEDLFENQHQETEKLKNVLKELEEQFDEFSIKVKKINSESLTETMQAELADANPIYEFIDFKNLVITPPSPAIKNKEMYTLYSSLNKDELKYNKVEYGKKIILDKNKNYAHIIVYKNKITFSTTNKEAITIENEDIKNSIEYLIKTIFNHQKK